MGSREVLSAKVLGLFPDLVAVSNRKVYSYGPEHLLSRAVTVSGSNHMNDEEDDGYCTVALRTRYGCGTVQYDWGTVAIRYGERHKYGYGCGTVQNGSGTVQYGCNTVQCGCDTVLPSFEATLATVPKSCGKRIDLAGGALVTLLEIVTIIQQLPCVFSKEKKRSPGRLFQSMNALQGIPADQPIRKSLESAPKKAHKKQATLYPTSATSWFQANS